MANKSKDLKNFVRDGKKILGAALNYMDIVRARNIPTPKEPLLFLKPISSYIENGQPIIIPKALQGISHEVELGVIIGEKCKHVTKKNAMRYVGGYCVALDMTAQCELTEARAKGRPWTLGKAFDTSTPVSAFIPLSEIPDPHNLPLWLKVNGQHRQKGNTKDLIFKIPDIIEYCSKYMTFEPNDLILTGTPNGASEVCDGDVIECGFGDKFKMTFNVKEES